MRLTITLAAWLLAAAVGVAEPARQITFDDLPDPAAQAFDDPFRAMGFEMLEELRTVVRLEERLATGEVTAEARSRLEATVASSRRALEKAGYDIDALLAARWSVAKKRQEARIATNPALAGSQVSLSGFIIPAGTGTSGRPVGYLVPDVGMCSHKPPPPPNQLVLIELPDGDDAATLYTPVRVSGRLEPVDHDATVFVLDGEVRMVGRWALAADEVKLLGPVAETPSANILRDPLTDVR